MLTVKNIQQYYGGSHILRDVGFEARAGEVTVLLGRNGVGKTTLLKSLMGLVPIKSGHIEFDGQRIERRELAPQGRGQRLAIGQQRDVFGERIELVAQRARVVGVEHHQFGHRLRRQAAGVAGAVAQLGVGDREQRLEPTRARRR